MAGSDSQTFLREFDRKLWTAADSRSAAEGAEGNLRTNLVAAVYKHAVLGLIFLKGVPMNTSRPSRSSASSWK